MPTAKTVHYIAPSDDAETEAEQFFDRLKESALNMLRAGHPIEIVRKIKTDPVKDPAGLVRDHVVQAVHTSVNV